ncbi:hypothetical protein [Thermus tenuipuniceus]|uniref:hypothetical protein n=1 Tax=Thermus tenuipuniceus TaxID=2078690 RepID=UPI000FF887D3|nr:hypothetical protein [Thermus tenuipuniceus]
MGKRRSKRGSKGVDYVVLTDGSFAPGMGGSASAVLLKGSGGRLEGVASAQASLPFVPDSGEAEVRAWLLALRTSRR